MPQQSCTSRLAAGIGAAAGGKGEETTEEEEEGERQSLLGETGGTW